MTELRGDSTGERSGETAAGDGDLPPGTMAGEYRIESLLGRGGMGAVYGAVQPEIGARVAIKVLGAALSRDPRLCKRFVDEARAVNKIRHPNIVDIFAFGRLPDGRQYFVMEWLEGQTLAARLARGPLPVSEARRLLLQICEALEAAHQEKIVHRDLKPENLWIATPRHGQPYAKVLDFGIAKLLENPDAPSATEAGQVMGTPYYMSPEQCRGETVDHRTDLYAMGVLLYFMWSGRLPFEGASFLAVVTQQITAAPPRPSLHRPIPARLEALILSCLEKDPARRPASAKALGQALDGALAEALPGETVAAARAAVATDARTATRETGAITGEIEDAPTTALPRRGGIIKIGLGIAVLAVLGAWMLTRGRLAPPPPTEPAAAREESPPAPRAEPPAPPAVPPPAREAAPPRAPTRARALPAKAPSRLEEKGYLKENPFR